MADPNRRYDDKQVGLILKRATELATGSSPDASPGDGVSRRRCRLPGCCDRGAYVVARRIYQSGHRKRARDLEKLLDRLVEQILQANAKRLDGPADAPALPPGNG